MNHAVFAVPHLDGLYEVMTGVDATWTAALGRAPGRSVQFDAHIDPNGQLRLYDQVGQPFDPRVLDTVTQLDAAVVAYGSAFQQPLTLLVTDSPSRPWGAVTWSATTRLELVYDPLVGPARERFGCARPFRKRSRGAPTPWTRTTTGTGCATRACEPTGRCRTARRAWSSPAWARARARSRHVQWSWMTWVSRSCTRTFSTRPPPSPARPDGTA